MKTYFPDALTYSCKTLPIQGQLRACFTVYLAFALDKRMALPDGEEYLMQDTFPQSGIIGTHIAWSAMMQSIDETSVFDLGVPKLYAEWFMGGCASTPQGSKSKILPVHVQVGDMSRDFMVTGDAVNDGISLPKSQEFSSMPFTWKNTYGGLQHAENPIGKGLDKDAQGAISLPNITAKDCLPNESACTLGRTHTANGFRAADKWANFPQNLGTYDNDWLANMWPGHPKDFDWSYYNMAQIPQRMPKTVADMGGFTGVEKFHISNMHSQCSDIYGSLPALRLRLFLEYVNTQKDGVDAQTNANLDAPSTWHEITPAADTLWLFPTQNVGLMLWHVTAPTTTERNADILSFAAHLESVYNEPVAASFCIQQAILLKEGQPVDVEVPPIVLPEVEEDKIKIPEIPKIPPLAVVPLVVPPLANSAVPEMPQTSPSISDPLHLDSLKENSQDDISMMVDTANAELAKHNLPLITQEAVNAHLDKNIAMLKNLDFEPKAQPPLDEVLMSAGFSAEKSKNMLLACELPIPVRGSFPDVTEYNKMLDQYFAKFSELTNANPKVMSNMREMVSMVDQAAAGELLPPAPISNLDMILNTGLRKEEAIKWAAALDTPMPEHLNESGVTQYLGAFEKALGKPDKSMQNIALKNMATNKALVYKYNPIMTQEIQNIAASEEGAAFAKPLEDMLKKIDMLDAPNMPPDPFDLKSLAMGCGVVSPAILKTLHRIDPLPLEFLVMEVPPKPEKAMEEEIPEEISEEIPQQEEVAPEELYIGPQNMNEFKQALLEGIDLTSYDMRNLDLSGLDLMDLHLPNLSGLLLDGALLHNAKLGNAIMQGTHLSNAKCNGTDFSACDLSNANLSNSHFQNCSFEKSISENTNFNECIIQNSSFAHANCKNTTWEYSHVEQCDFNYADLSKSTWYHSRFINQHMENVQLNFAGFDQCSLAQSAFHGDMERVSFQNCDLTKTDFQNANLVKARFYHSNITEANLKDVNMTNSNWWGMQGNALRMPNALLQNATFEECVFHDLHAPCLVAQECNWMACDLSNAMLKHMNLFKGSLRDCIVAGADISNSNLYDADLYLMRPSKQTNFFNTDLTNTCLTRGLTKG